MTGSARTDVRYPHLATLLAAALALAIAAGAAAAPPLPTASDRTGDGHGAPDVCAVTVSASAAAVTFRIAFADRPSLKGGERVSLVLDADRSDATGNPALAGADLLLSWGISGQKTFAGEVLRWQRTRWALAPAGTSAVRFRPGKGVLSVVLDRTLLRGRFDWAVLTFAAGRNRGSDAAPDTGMAAYPPAKAASAAGCGAPSTSA